MRRFAARSSGLAVSALVLIAAGALAVRMRSSASRAKEDARRPNVLLVSLDTTRADHTSAYGYPRPTTPNLARLLGDSVRFEAAYAPTATTLPSHVTMFTGLHPRAHGVRKNGQALADGVVTLAEIFAGAGWDTAGFVSSLVLDRRFGVMQGFATYGDRFSGARCKSQDKKRRRARDLEGFCRRGEETIAEAIAWLEARGHLAKDSEPRAPGREPFFVFVHLFDPHEPYRPPPEHADAFPAIGTDPTELGREIAAYDAEIHYADAQVGKLLDRLASAGVLDETLVVVTADHGEGLDQHGWMHHGLQIYEEAVRVPLIFRWPAALRGGRSIAAPVALVDLAPTLVRLAGIPASLPRAGGVDLSGVLAGDAGADPDREIFLERRPYVASQVDGFPVEGEKRGVRAGKWKYIVAEEENTRELYALDVDPGETRNVAEQEVAARDRLQAILDRWLRAEPAAAPLEVAPEDAKRLRNLGYVQ